MPTTPDIVQKPLVFSGEFRPLLDGKKRLTIPARWRSEALEELVHYQKPGPGLPGGDAAAGARGDGPEGGVTGAAL